MPKYSDSIERIKQCFFIDEDSYPIKLSDYEKNILRRLMGGYSFYLRWPQKGDREVVEFLKRAFNVEKTQAYIDLKHIKTLLGNIQTAGKEWHRHTVIEMAKEAYAVAKKKDDPIGMVMALDKIGKYTRADQDDAESIPWEKVFNSLLEPSNDPRILKIRNPKDAEARRHKLIKKYYPEEVEDAELA